MLFSSYNLSIGDPCYTYAGYTITDDSNGTNADSEFLYDESTSTLTLIGTIEKSNTLRSYSLHILIDEILTGSFY